MAAGCNSRQLKARKPLGAIAFEFFISGTIGRAGYFTQIACRLRELEQAAEPPT